MPDGQEINARYNPDLYELQPMDADSQDPHNGLKGEIVDIRMIGLTACLI